MPIPLGVLAVAGAGAAGGGSYELIESVILTGNQASVTFSNIPQTYKHLQIRAISRTDFAANFIMTATALVNNDSGANYARHEISADGTSVASVSAVSQNSIALNSFSTGASTTASSFVPAIIDVLDYSSTTKNKTFRTLNGAANPGSTYRGIYFQSALWMSTSAITSFQITGGGNFVSGSRFSLYGIKG